MATGVGLRIRERRKSLNLSQESLAKRMGLKSKSTICKIERGEDNLTTDTIVKYAEALHTSPAFLMGWVQDPNPRYNPRELDNMYTDIEIEDEIISDVEQKATLLYEKYLNAPDDVRSVIDRLLESSQSQP